MKKKLKLDGETIYEEMKMMCMAMQNPRLTLSATILSAYPQTAAVSTEK